VQAVRALLTVTGADRPGVTAALFEALARRDVEVRDVEQVVIRGQLLLGIAVALPADRDMAALRAEVAPVGRALGCGSRSRLPPPVRTRR